MVVQLSDLHLRDGEAGVAPALRLQRVLDAVAELLPRPQAVLLSGDIVDSPSGEAYDQALRMLGGLALPLHAIPGNHDDRDMLRERFGPSPAPSGAPVNFAVDCGALRLIGVDSVCPGRDGGALGEGQLDWLARALAEDPGRATLLALHHPPAMTGVGVMDAISLAAADRTALEDLLAGCPQVKAITCGHAHTTMLTSFAGRPLIVCPSTNSPLRLDLRPRDDLPFEAAPRPIGFAVHALVEGRLLSHVQPVDQPSGR